MLLTLCRWKIRLWLRALNLGERRRPLFKICLLAWLLSLPAACALIQHKAAAPWPPEPLRLGLLRWSTCWAGLVQAGLAVLLLAKLIEKRQDAPLQSHPASWRPLLVHRITFSVAGASMLFALALLTAFHGPLLLAPDVAAISSALVFASAWTLQALVVSVLALAALCLFLARSRALSDLGSLRGPALAVFALSVFLLSWGGDWMLRHQTRTLGLLGVSSYQYSFVLWMPFQALHGFQQGLSWSPTTLFSALGGMALLSTVFLAGPNTRTARALWPEVGGDDLGRALSLSLLNQRRTCQKVLGRCRLMGHLAFKDLLAPAMGSYRRLLFSLAGPCLLALTLPLLIGHFHQIWMHVGALSTAGAIAAPGLCLWKNEMAVAGLLRPWLSLRRLFFCKALVWILWVALQTLLVTLILPTAAWAAALPAEPFVTALATSVAPLSLLSYLMGWLLQAGTLPRQAATVLSSPPSLQAPLLFWALVSWLLLPPPIRLPLAGLVPLLALAGWMSWRRLLCREEAAA